MVLVSTDVPGPSYLVLLTSGVKRQITKSFVTTLWTVDTSGPKVTVGIVKVDSQTSVQ